VPDWSQWIADRRVSKAQEQDRATGLMWLECFCHSVGALRRLITFITETPECASLGRQPDRRISDA
jgi:hypothetical protein